MTNAIEDPRVCKGKINIFSLFVMLPKCHNKVVVIFGILLYLLQICIKMKCKTPPISHNDSPLDSPLSALHVPHSHISLSLEILSNV